MLKKFSVSLVLGVVLVLAACGKGGGKRVVGANIPPAAVNAGVFGTWTGFADVPGTGGSVARGRLRLQPANLSIIAVCEFPDVIINSMLTLAVTYGAGNTVTAPAGSSVETFEGKTCEAKHDGLAFTAVLNGAKLDVARGRDTISLTRE